MKKQSKHYLRLSHCPIGYDVKTSFEIVEFESLKELKEDKEYIEGVCKGAVKYFELKEKQL